VRRSDQPVPPSSSGPPSPPPGPSTVASPPLLPPPSAPLPLLLPLDEPLPLPDPLPLLETPLELVESGQSQYPTWPVESHVVVPVSDPLHAQVSICPAGQVAPAELLLQPLDERPAARTALKAAASARALMILQW
jgi:hypothetical protein